MKKLVSLFLGLCVLNTEAKYFKPVAATAGVLTVATGTAWTLSKTEKWLGAPAAKAADDVQKAFDDAKKAFDDANEKLTKAESELKTLSGEELAEKTTKIEELKKASEETKKAFDTESAKMPKARMLNGFHTTKTFYALAIASAVLAGVALYLYFSEGKESKEEVAA